MDFIQLSCLGLTFRVGSHDRSDIIWLREFLCPQFKITDTGSCDCRIQLLFDDERFNNLLKDGFKGRAEVDGFVLDKKIVRLIFWESSGAGRILFDPEFKVFYLVSGNKKEVTVLAHSAVSIAFRTALMRVMTEFAMNYAGRYGGGFVHSSALAYRGRGIIIAGPENSGKTSLLVFLLQNLPSSRFVSNDRVLVCLDDDAPVIHGVPTVITVARDGLGMFPRLRESLARYNFHHRYTMEEIRQRGCRPYRLETGEYTVSAGQFCRLLKVEALSEVALSAVLFPRISRNTGGIRLKKLSQAIALARLKEARFAKGIKETQPFFRLNNDGYHALKNVLDYEEFSERIVGLIPCFDCCIGLNNYEGNDAPELIREVFLKKRQN